MRGVLFLGEAELLRAQQRLALGARLSRIPAAFAGSRATAASGREAERNRERDGSGENGPAPSAAHTDGLDCVGATSHHILLGQGADF
ncbi:MAG: hypothetical protein ACRDQ2_05320 [Gaiellales bacterium]